MRTLHIASLATLLLAPPIQPFPADFKVRDITTNGATLHVRYGGHGPAVVLLHGFGDTGDMWAPLAAVLERDHLVIVPDLRGMGLSSHPAEGYHKRIQADDIAGILDTLGVTRAGVVGHDIGNMVAFAFTARYPQRVSRLVLIDAPIPGVGNWDALSHDPKAWHFYFFGPDEERLVAGRERIFLDRFYDEFGAHPDMIDEQTREHYAALYALPGAMHSALMQFHAFPQDAIDNRASLAHGKLATPTMAIGGSASYGTQMAAVASAAFTTVDGRVVADAGHWIMEEQPAALIALIVPFLAETPKP